MNLRLLFTVALLLWSCGRERGAGPPPGSDGGSPLADGAMDRDGGGVPFPDAARDDGGWPPATMVTCVQHEGPTLVITRPNGGTGPSSALLHLTLRFHGAATAIAIDSIEQRDDAGALARAWDPALLDPPDGFDGRATPRDGYPYPELLFTSTADAIASEVDACDEEAWDRSLGTLVVHGRTTETGDFEATCSLGRADALSPLAVACARGLPGFMAGAYSPLSDPSTPYDYVLVENRPTAINDSAAPIDAYEATSVSVRVRPYERTLGGACPDPGDWDAPGGTHRLWFGMSSEDVWSGPLAPGSEQTVWYIWQSPGSLPPGICVPPVKGLPGPDTCFASSLQVVLRGTSSAGDWEWESDVFDCIDHSGS